jgi:hypothetical protein
VSAVDGVAPAGGALAWTTGVVLVLDIGPGVLVPDPDVSDDVGVFSGIRIALHARHPCIFCQWNRDQLNQSPGEQ